MSMPNQKSIVSFFQAPKRLRPPESIIERPSKQTRTVIPVSDDIDLSDDPEINKNMEDLEDIEDEMLSIVEDQSNASELTSSIGDVTFASNSTQMSKQRQVRVFLWKDEYSILFPWLKYNSVTETALCSYGSCTMYDIFFIITNI